MVGPSFVPFQNKSLRNDPTRAMHLLRLKLLESKD
jgi:hypothetical protein